MSSMDDQPAHKGGRRHSPTIAKSLAAFLPDAAALMEPPEVLRSQTQSKLPTYRHVDLQKLEPALAMVHGDSQHLRREPLTRRTEDEGANRDNLQEGQPSATDDSLHVTTIATSAAATPSTNTTNTTTRIILANPPKKHIRNHSTPSATNRDTKTQSAPKSHHKQQHSTSALLSPRLSRHFSVGDNSLPRSRSNSNLIPPWPVDVLDSPATTKPAKATRRIYPAAAVATSTTQGSRNTKPNNGPPLSMITQGFYDGHGHELETDSTTNLWVAQQSMSLTPAETHQPPPTPAQQQTSPPATDTSLARPVIKPIRGFKPSSRKSLEMSPRRTSRDPDETLRALDGFEDVTSPQNSNSHQQQHNIEQTEQDEQTTSDESDLFLRAAKEEEKSARQNNNVNSNSPSRSDSRFARTGQRASLPPSSIVSNPTISRRRGSDQESSNGPRPPEEQDSVAQALTYRPPAKDRPTPPEDMNRNRYLANSSRSNPTTPRNFNNSRERSPESPASYGPRRTIPDATLPARSSYRQSNLSYTIPRTYNSSPLVSRSTDMHEDPETPRATEGTESSVSTTAPSTVWDELEDLKSRIHRLELTGKLPATSGAAMSRASNDRPPTATTTVTTISSSPKRGRGNSISPEDPVPAEAPHTETHPLLHSALAKSKPILSPEIFKALEAAATDALAIASMMGISGQPGPISSSQSTIGGPSAVSDRQVRRKADSMCRSLTELCLALSEAEPETASPVSSPPSKAIAVRPSIHDTTEVRMSTEIPKQRQLTATDVGRMKPSPRALSRLEERRSSLLATSTLPSPRYNPSEAGTPAQTGRRTSMFLRTRRAATEEPEEDETRFRAPSRANTEIGRLRNSPREYTSQQPLPERQSAIQSSLPVRRHYTSTSLTNAAPPMPPVSSLGGRRYLERSTPERDNASVVSRLAEDREQRKSSISQGFLGRKGSLTRKARQPTPTGSPGQTGSY